MALIDLNSGRYYKILLGNDKDVAIVNIYDTKEIRDKEKSLSYFKDFVENEIKEKTNYKFEILKDILIEKGFYEEGLNDEEQMIFIEETYEDPLATLNSILEEDTNLKELWDDYEMFSNEGLDILSFFNTNYEDKSLDSVEYVYYSMIEDLEQFDIYSKEDFLKSLVECSPFYCRIEAFVPDLPLSLKEAYEHIQEGKHILSNFEDDIDLEQAEIEE